MDGEETILLKADFESESSRKSFAYEMQVVPQSIAWEDLELMLKVYSDQDQISVYYFDDEQDQIRIESQDELQEAFKVARKTNNTINLRIVCGAKLPVQSDRSIRNTRRTSLYNRKEGQSSEEDYQNRFAGKWFYLRCTRSGLVLDVCGASRAPGTKVILWPRKSYAEGVSNQLWRVDGVTLRSRMNDACLDVNDAHALVVNPYSADRCTQLWRLDGGRLKSLYNDYWVMGVKPEGGMAKAGDEMVVSYRPGGVIACEWSIEFEESIPAKICLRAQQMYAEIMQRQAGLTQTLKSDQACAQHSKTMAAVPALNDGIRVDSRVHHYGVICDVCDDDILGVRYKCCHCVNYDLCEKCEALEGSHNPSHILLKIRVPLERPLVVDPLIEMFSDPHDPVFISNPVLVQNNGCIKAGPGCAIFRQLEDNDVIRQDSQLSKKLKKLKRKEEKLMKKAEKLFEMCSVTCVSAQHYYDSRRESSLTCRHDNQLGVMCDTEYEVQLPLDLSVSAAPEERPGSMSATFERDETFPDGSHVQPGERLTKKWILSNSGEQAWASKTVLKHVIGTMDFQHAQFSVPYVQPGHSGTVSVELTAPLTPGHYESYWRLCSHNEPFGPVIWCAVYVDEPTDHCDNSNKMSEAKDKSEAITTESEETCDGACVEDEKLMENRVERHETQQHKVQDLLNSMELLVKRDVEGSDDQLQARCPASPSLTVPANTPIVVTPPGTPANHVVASQSVIDSDDHCVSENDKEDEKNKKEEEEEDSSSVACEEVELVNMMDKVQERMSDLTVDADYEYVAYESGSESDDSHSGDFFIVPIPDCFNTQLPARKEASTSVLVKKCDTSCTASTSGSVMSVDKMMSSSVCLPSRQPHVFEFDKADSLTSDSDDDDDLSMLSDDSTASEVSSVTSCTLDNCHDDVMTSRQRVQSITEASRLEEQTAQGTVREEHKEEGKERDESKKEEDRERQLVNRETGENVATITQQVSGETFSPSSVENPTGQATEEAGLTGGCSGSAEGGGVADGEEREVEGQGEQAEEAIAVSIGSQQTKQTNLEEIAMNLMSTAVGVASKAATVAFYTAKDVYHTLQARNTTYVPPRSSWTPPTNDWTPPPSTWTPVQPTWSPPSQQWIQPDQPIWSPPGQQWIQPEQTSAGVETLVEATVNPNAAYMPQSHASLDPMQQLIEMGFANRQVNEEILAECQNDVQAAVQELLLIDQGWATSRH